MISKKQNLDFLKSLSRRINEKGNREEIDQEIDLLAIVLPFNETRVTSNENCSFISDRARIYLPTYICLY